MARGGEQRRQVTSLRPHSSAFAGGHSMKPLDFFLCVNRVLDTHQRPGSWKTGQDQWCQGEGRHRSSGGKATSSLQMETLCQAGGTTGGRHVRWTEDLTLDKETILKIQIAQRGARQKQERQMSGCLPMQAGHTCLSRLRNHLGL
ncbi:uncharacterized protein RBU33_012124 isoform 1-T1 [Hipposideros larvatus]